MAALAALIAAVVTAAGTKVVEVAARYRGALDEPNERSSHLVPTPRLGGIGIMAGVSVGFATAGGLEEPRLVLILLGATAIGIVGVIDDIRRVPAVAKLAAQVVTAGIVATLAVPSVTVMLPGAELQLEGVLAAVAATAWIVVMCNVVNFMDGTDGLVALSILVAAVTVTLAGGGTSVLFASLAGACIGFLVWNRPRASIFMGDSGSQYLGFLVGAGALLAPGGPVPYGFILLGALIFDVTVTLTKRAIRGADLVEAHRDHLYQRLADAWGHGSVAALFGATGVVGAVSALGYATGELPAQVAAIALVAIALAVIARVANSVGGTTP